MSATDRIIAPIADDMEKFEPYFRASMKNNVPLLSLITNYILRTKGKQMRPMLVFLSAKLVGQICDSTYNAAALIELLHTATLIHDDVVDESSHRRGFFSINALWKSKVAVLVGDFFLSKGLLLAVEKSEFALLKIVSDAVREMSEGELLQIEKSRKLNITEEIYYEIIRKKTATLIAACTSSGAKSTGANDEVVEKMRLFGEYIGMAFQIKDDIFDYQKNMFTGKPSGNDIKEKKLTLPLIHVLEKISPSQKKQILSTIRNHHDNPKKVNEIMEFVVSNGGLDYAIEKMNLYKKQALDLLNTFENNDASKALTELANYTTDRNK